MERLNQRWGEILGASASLALAELTAAYSGPDRRYHNLAHLEALLDLSAEHAPSLADRDAVDLAIFYHDAVHDPARTDNEARSAGLAGQRLSAIGLSPDRVAKVVRFIEATKHSAAPTAGDSDLDHLLDFDLAILAAEPVAYDAYAHAIRREFAVYPDAHYRPGRAKVLHAFLAMPSIYRVGALARRWEARARANLTAELAALA